MPPEWPKNTKQNSRPSKACSGQRFDSHRRVVPTLGDPFTECSGIPFQSGHAPVGGGPVKKG